MASSKLVPPKRCAQLAELTGFPVVTTLMARGAFPDDHELCLGMPGMHGNYTAITAMQQSDLLIALGPRFDDRVTGKLDAFAPDAKIIHVDIDPAELGKVRRPDVPIVGDCRLVIEEMVKAVHAEKSKRDFPSLDGWHIQLRQWQEQFPLHYEQAEDGPLKPQYVIDQLRDNTPDDTIVASGVGQHQMWTSQRWKFNHPYTWVNSGGLGTMGFAVPAAIGAKVGKPERMVWAVDGDGCFQMTAQELVTASGGAHPGEDRHPQQRLPRHGAPVAGAVLRGALQRGVPLARPARLRDVGGSDGVRGVPGRHARGRRGHDPESERGRRPTGRDRLPHRLSGEGVPDGRARHVEQRRDPRPRTRPPGWKGRGTMATTETSGKHHILTVLVENKFGVLSRVAGLFSRRGFNIVSLAVSPTEDERFSRMTIVVDAESAPLEQITKQLNKLIPVLKIAELHPDEAVERELMLVTVKATPELRSQITELASIFQARIDDVGHDALTIQVAGAPEKLDAMTDLLAAVRHPGAPAHRPHRPAQARPAPGQAPCREGPRRLTDCSAAETDQEAKRSRARRAGRRSGVDRYPRSSSRARHDLLRRRRRSRPARGPQGRGPRLRVAGPRPRPEHAQDSGVDVRVGLREGSSSWAKAQEAGPAVRDASARPRRKPT